ncbi:MAG: hypothetical protein O7G85_10135 [Planctomycetota bacterium]|nr:hypothetical protein [Planctomycetota bacterium]
MPYIPPEDRARYDEAIDQLATLLNQQSPDKRKGHANYVITQILRHAWGVHETAGESYSNYADLIGTFECAKLEIYRRWVATYEDQAIEKNGDLDMGD